MSYFRDMRWTCHICEEERPDEFISVFKRQTEPFITQNIRFCNDKQECTAKAQTFSFLDDN